ncbi:MAG: hypothetical protein ABSG04_15220 [Verrucomicrobiota bacterium]
MNDKVTRSKLNDHSASFAAAFLADQESPGFGGVPCLCGDFMGNLGSRSLWVAQDVMKFFRWIMALS